MMGAQWEAAESGKAVLKHSSGQGQRSTVGQGESENMVERWLTAGIIALHAPKISGVRSSVCGADTKHDAFLSRVTEIIWSLVVRRQVPSERGGGGYCHLFQ